MSAEPIPSRMQWATSIAKICNRLPNKEGLYANYRIISGMTHAGFGSAGMYFGNLVDNTPLEPITVYGHTLVTTASAVVCSCMAFDHVLGTNTAEAVEAVGDRLNVKPLFLAPEST